VRGPTLDDAKLFDAAAMATLARAAADLRYLLSRGYAQKSSIALVGDHAQLVKRQRQLLMRAVSSPSDAAAIRARTVAPEEVRGQLLLIDGYNVLITLETALNGGPLIESDEGFLRDLSEIHGAYRENESTPRAIELVRALLADLAPDKIEIYLDRPISFSARFAEKLRQQFGAHTSVALADSADGAIKVRLDETHEAILASGDGALLRRGARCIDLVGTIARRSVPKAWLLQLDTPACDGNFE
jgi:hypothetical protein